MEAITLKEAVMMQSALQFFRDSLKSNGTEAKITYNEQVFLINAEDIQTLLNKLRS